MMDWESLRIQRGGGGELQQQEVSVAVSHLDQTSKMAFRGKALFRLHVCLHKPPLIGSMFS